MIFIVEMSDAVADWKWQNPLPNGNYIEDIWVFPNNQIIAVGNAGTIIQFNGTQWVTMGSDVTVDLEAIWAISPDNVYAAGAKGTILRFHNNQWVQEQHTSQDNFTDIWGINDTIYVVGKNVMILGQNTSLIPENLLNGRQLNGIYGSSKKDLFVVGDKGTIIHFNGTQWTRNSCPTQKNLNAIWGNNSEYFCVGEDGVVLHYTNATWSIVETNLSFSLNAIQGNDSDIWITGGLWQNSGIVLKYDNISSPIVLNNTPFSSIGISHTNEMVVAGSEIYHYDDGIWSCDTRFRTGDVQSIRDIWGHSDNEIYSVGDNGTLLTYNGHKWERINTATSDHLNGIWGAASDNIYAVGANGMMIHYNGVSWTVGHKITTNDLKDIWATHDNQFFAVGSNGTFLHYQNNAWISIETNTTASLNAIWGFSDTNLYIVGNNALILHYNGYEFTEMPTASYNEDLRSIWGADPHNIYAVGRKGLILKYNGQTWIKENNVPQVHLDAVWGIDQDIFAAGEYGTILHKNGSKWETMNSGTTNWLAAGWAVNEYDFLAAGFGGSILKHERQRLHLDAPQYVYQSDNSISITISVYPAISQAIQVTISSDSTYIPYTDSIQLTSSQQSITKEISLNNPTINGHKRVRITAQFDKTNTVSTDIWILDTQSVDTQPLTATCIKGWDDTSIYAMGNNGNIYTLHSDNYQQIPFYWDTDLNDIWFASRNTAYAVGKAGMIMHYNGFDWKIMQIDPEGNDFYGIWGTSDRNVYLVGENGTIGHYNGNTWENMDSGTSYNLHAIWGTSENNIYAVGEASTIVHYDGSQWVPFMEKADFDLFDIWGITQNEIYVAGSDGMMFFYDGNHWKKIDLGLTSDLYSIWGSCHKDLFVAGENGVIRYFDGNIWLPLFKGTVNNSQTFRDIWGLNGKNVYIAGDTSLIHYQPGGIKLSPIHSHYVCENLTLSIPFQLTDTNDYQNISLFGESSNDQLVPNDSSHIYFQGTDNNQWMIIKPRQGQTGDTIITLTASESDNFPCMTSFKVTVLSSREALLKLYKETDGDNWYNNKGWKSDPVHTDLFALPGTECSWFGVDCDPSENTIIGLSLNANALKGKIPGEIFGLSQLITIDLAYNHLKGDIPHQIVSLNHLKKLNIASNMLNGNIPKNIFQLDEIRNRSSDFRWNALMSSNKAVNDYLNQKQIGGNWIATQTLPPSKLTASVLQNSFLFRWNVIDYYQNDGGYDLIYTLPDFTYSDQPLDTIYDKNTQQAIIDSLQTNNRYQFGIRTFTNSHENNPNTIYSNYAYTNTVGLSSPPSIQLIAPDFVYEGHAPQRCSVKIDSPQTIDLNINLYSDDSSVQPVPLTTTIFAGKTEAFFYLKINNDGHYIQEKQVTINAFAMGKPLNPIAVIIKDQETPYWKPKSIPSQNNLNAIYGFSQSNVIAVGNYGTALHYDGLNWTLKTTGTTEDLHDVWGNSKNNVYAVGAAGTIIHFDGYVWQKVLFSESFDLFAIDGIATDSIYVAGASQHIFHFDGFQWENALVETINGNISENTIADMWTYTENALIAIGNAGTTYFESEPTLLQMAHETITITPNNQTPFSNEKHTGIWGLSQDNYFVSGYAESSLEHTGIIYHKAGRNQTCYTEANVRLMDIWGATNKEVYAVGDTGSILLFNGKQWHQMPTGTDVTLNGIWGLRDTSIIAVGDQGTILHFESDKPDYFVDDAFYIPAGSTREEYVIASIYVNLNEKQSTKVFPNYISSAYATGENYRIGAYDPILGDYIEYGTDLLIEPGKAYWFLFRDTTTIPIKGEAISCVLNFDLPLLYNADTNDGWNMIACPNNMNYQWSKLKVFAKNNSGEIVDSNGNYLNESEIPFIFELSEDNPYIHPLIYEWTGDMNHPYNDYSDMTMIKNQGYWVSAKTKNVYLRFSHSAQVTHNRKRIAQSSSFSKSTKMPPMPMGELSASMQTNEKPHVSDAFCFIKACLY